MEGEVPLHFLGTICVNSSRAKKLGVVERKKKGEINKIKLNIAVGMSRLVSLSDCLSKFPL